VKTYTVDEIRNMEKDKLEQLNRELAKKLAIRMMAMVWLKVTVPAVAQVCLKHAAIRAAKNL
jgi:hypothetical protein